MVPPDSGRIPPVPPYSGYSPLNIPFSHTGLSPSTAVLSRTLPLRYVHDLGVLQPRKRLDVPGLGSSAFARHYSRNHYCFLFLRLLRCFSSAGSPPSKGCLAFNQTGCPIRKSGYQYLFAVTPGLSQLVTSFFASRSLGIPRAPLVTFRLTINDITLFARALLFFLVARYELSLILISRVFFHHVNELLPSGSWRIRESNP